jgi:hypothetical protein
MPQNLNEIVFKLDDEVSSIGVSVNRLLDAEILLDQLVDAMDKAIRKGEEKAYYQEHFRMVKVLSYFISNSVEDLSRDYEKTAATSQELFKGFRTESNHSSEVDPGTEELKQLSLY